jgi:hypothetical protein
VYQVNRKKKKLLGWFGDTLTLKLVSNSLPIIWIFFAFINKKPGKLPAHPHPHPFFFKLEGKAT